MKQLKAASKKTAAPSIKVTKGSKEEEEEDEEMEDAEEEEEAEEEDESLFIRKGFAGKKRKVSSPRMFPSLCPPPLFRPTPPLKLSFFLLLLSLYHHSQAVRTGPIQGAHLPVRAPISSQEDRQRG